MADQTKVALTNDDLAACSHAWVGRSYTATSASESAAIYDEWAKVGARSFVGSQGMDACGDEFRPWARALGDPAPQSWLAAARAEGRWPLHSERGARSHLFSTR